MNKQLDDREYNRLKELVDSGRKFHYRNFFFAALSTILLLKDQNESLNLVFDIELPIGILIIALYALSAIFTALTIDISLAVNDYIPFNLNGYVPYNWIILTGRQSPTLQFIYILLPFVISSICLCLTDITISKLATIYIGTMCCFLPSYLDRAAFILDMRTDDKKNKINLSTYLLNWYRIIRLLALLAIAGLIIYNSTLSSDQNCAKFVEKIILWVVSIMITIRVAGAIFYKKIDKIGNKYGFND